MAARRLILLSKGPHPWQVRHCAQGLQPELLADATDKGVAPACCCCCCRCPVAVDPTLANPKAAAAAAKTHPEVAVAAAQAV